MSDAFFDATQVAPSTGTPDPIPVGRYPLAVELAERKTTDSGWGVNCTIVVQDGEYKGRKLFQFFNLEHKNSADAQRIGQEQFSALCHATGVLKPAAPSDLHNQPFLADVGIKKRKDTGEPQNVLNKYYKIDGTKIGGGGVAGAIAPSQPSRPTASAAPAWANKKAS